MTRRLPPPAATFSFHESWTVGAPLERVHGVLADLGTYPVWWPEVRAVARLGDDEAFVVCRSVLPYDLELHLTAVHREPARLEIAMAGDLVGSARWTLSSATPSMGPATGQPATALEFRQDVEVARPLLALAARAGRPAMVWNHHRMMRSCLRGLGERLGCRVLRGATV